MAITAVMRHIERVHTRVLPSTASLFPPFSRSSRSFLCLALLLTGPSGEGEWASLRHTQHLAVIEHGGEGSVASLGAAEGSELVGEAALDKEQDLLAEDAVERLAPDAPVRIAQRLVLRDPVPVLVES
eukprot:3396813-Rhodomonas_salina.2